MLVSAALLQLWEHLQMRVVCTLGITDDMFCYACACEASCSTYGKFVYMV